MKTALFTNFTNEDFTGYWDGKAKVFKAGQSVYMPDYLAEHFAKHLTNRELLKRKNDGTLIIPNGDKFVSPKRPEQVPVYMELFNKAFTPEDKTEFGSEGDDIDALIGAANKNHAEGKTMPEDAKSADTVDLTSDVTPTTKQDKTQPQVIVPPDFDAEDDDSEESFGGKPQDITVEITEDKQ